MSDVILIFALFGLYLDEKIILWANFQQIETPKWHMLEQLLCCNTFSLWWRSLYMSTICKFTLKIDFLLKKESLHVLQLNIIFE